MMNRTHAKITEDYLLYKLNSSLSKAMKNKKLTQINILMSMLIITPWYVSHARRYAETIFSILSNKTFCCVVQPVLRKCLTDSEEF